MDELYDIKNLKIDYCHDGSAKVFLKTKIHRQVLCDIYGGKDGQFEGLLLVKLVNAIKEYMEERSWLTWGKLPEETTACKIVTFFKVLREYKKMAKTWSKISFFFKNEIDEKEFYEAISKL